MFADVALPQRRYQVFTYLIPQRLQGRLHIASRVLVPFGRTTLQGMVLAFPDSLDDSRFSNKHSMDSLREIAELVDSSAEAPLDPALIVLANRVVDYYVAPLASGLRLVLPPTSSKRISKRIVLTDRGKKALESLKLSRDQATVLTRLQSSSNGLMRSSINKLVKGAGNLVVRLKRHGWVQEFQSVQDGTGIRSKKSSELFESSNLPSKKFETESKSVGCEWSRDTSTDQEERRRVFQGQNSLTNRLPEWWEVSFRRNLTKQCFDEILLDAPDTFRRTFLIQAVQETLSHQRSALVLAPEINQAQHLAAALKAHCDARVALFHSDLSQGARRQIWQQLRAGMFEVVVGTRSALFVPLSFLGMVWVDNEEDYLFKEEQSPHYHARDVARMRAKLENAVLFLGTSHPSLETFHTLSTRFPSVPLPNVSKSTGSPSVEIVDLRQMPYGTLLSEAMIHGLQRTIDSAGRSILYLNRKGFSRSLSCRDCGYVPKCTSCSVTLTVYKRPPCLICSYCGRSQPIPIQCPSCLSVHLEPIGFGTERLEELVRQQFPSAKVARFDRFTVNNAADEEAICNQFRDGEIHILIGTELLIHSRRVPHASFVGVPYADAGLHAPDFRSGEWTYHLLNEVLELCDVDLAHPEVVLQTYLPSHHVMSALVQRNPHIFYEHELDIRRALDYPPFTHLIQVALSGKHQDRVEEAAKRCGEILRVEVAASPSAGAGCNGREETILGPIRAFKSQRHVMQRWLILIKSHDLEKSRQLVRMTRKELDEKLKKGRLTFEINVDPMEIL